MENRSDVYRKLESEINDPNVLGQLHGVQETAFLVGGAIESIDLAIPGKKGWIDMAEALLKRFHDERTALSGKVDTAGMDPGEAKIRVDQMGSVIQLTETVLAESYLEIDKMISRKDGLKSAEDIAAQQFDRIVAVHERERRIAAEDSADRGGFSSGQVVADVGGNGGNGKMVLDPLLQLDPAPHSLEPEVAAVEPKRTKRKYTKRKPKSGSAKKKS